MNTLAGVVHLFISFQLMIFFWMATFPKDAKQSLWVIYVDGWKAMAKILGMLFYEPFRAKEVP